MRTPSRTPSRTHSCVSTRPRVYLCAVGASVHELPGHGLCVVWRTEDPSLAVPRFAQQHNLTAVRPAANCAACAMISATSQAPILTQF